MIAGLGDSLTAGWLVEQSFFTMACTALNIRGLNLGMPGNTAKDGLARVYQAFTNQKPSLLLIQFGINDWSINEDLEEFQNNLFSISKIATKNGIKPILLTSCPIEYHPSSLEQYYKQIRLLAKRENIALYDLARCWRQSPNEVGLYMEDGVHPSSLGHKRMANCLIESLKNEDHL